MLSFKIETFIKETWISVKKRAFGQEILDQTLIQLNLQHAVNLFGIRVRTSRGRCKWLHLRNTISVEFKNYTALTLRVKFYIQPQQLDVNTRKYLYRQLLQDLRDGTLKPSSQEQAIQLVTLIAQAHHGPGSERNTIADSIFETYCKMLTPETEVSEDVLQRIMGFCKKMSGLSKRQAQMKLLELASTLPLYGFERHVTGNTLGIIALLIGSSGLKIEYDRHERNLSIPFSEMMSISQDGGKVDINTCQVGQSPRCLRVRMCDKDQANAAYRSLGEMKTFYHDDEVPASVRDMTEQSFIGKKYVFDVTATLRQIEDYAQRSHNTMRIVREVVDSFSRGTF
ncbi:E3 ubiquitin-protein ligase MYLIP-A-like [Dreissena polymorpha]|uniref:FERM domain-containing protein n=1 Tax=Dreissena polymorpha TaxID=45954 RepID=A0A9D4II55_DREPO|nr:E3 ubiquitin-protein ligase MYLIP-A-like [Dreissena polymorpha]KAH3773989.1 hypothetical protein DPMN_175360 [Dreissena polymorpha]